MERTINAKTLRRELTEIVRRVRQGASFTVIYRSRPSFRLVSVPGTTGAEPCPLADEPLYRMPALGRSTDGRTSEDTDTVLYGGPS